MNVRLTACSDAARPFISARNCRRSDGVIVTYDARQKRATPSVTERCEFAGSVSPPRVPPPGRSRRRQRENHSPTHRRTALAGVRPESSSRCACLGDDALSFLKANVLPGARVFISVVCERGHLALQSRRSLTGLLHNGVINLAGGCTLLSNASSAFCLCLSPWV